MWRLPLSDILGAEPGVASVGMTLRSKFYGTSEMALNFRDQQSIVRKDSY